MPKKQYLAYCLCQINNNIEKYQRPPEVTKDPTGITICMFKVTHHIGFYNEVEWQHSSPTNN